MDIIHERPREGLSPQLPVKPSPRSREPRTDPRGPACPAHTLCFISSCRGLDASRPLLPRGGHVQGAGVPKKLIYHYVTAKQETLPRLKVRWRTFLLNSLKFLVFQESLGNTLLEKGRAGGVFSWWLCNLSRRQGLSLSEHCVRRRKHSPWQECGRCQEAQAGRGEPAPRYTPSRVCSGAGCRCEPNRFGLRFHLGKDRVRRGLFLCVSTLLMSTDGKLNYQ